jgi:hypothetical protein
MPWNPNYFDKTVDGEIRRSALRGPTLAEQVSALEMALKRSREECAAHMGRIVGLEHLLNGEEVFRALARFREQIAQEFEKPVCWTGVDLYQGATYGLAAARLVRAVPLPGEPTRHIPLSWGRTAWNRSG